MCQIFWSIMPCNHTSSEILTKGEKTGRARIQKMMHIFENFINRHPILHYTLVTGCCTTLQKIFDTITANTGLSKGHKENVHGMDIKEHQSTFVKNVTLDCIQTVLKHTLFLKNSQYERLYKSFCINFTFVVVCINKSYDQNNCNKFHEKPTGTFSPLASV